MNLLGRLFFWWILNVRLIHKVTYYCQLKWCVWCWGGSSHILLYESIEEIVLLVDTYCLLYKVTYFCQLKRCDWCWGGSSYIIPSVYIIPALSKNNLRMIFPVPIIVLWIYWGGCSSGRFLLSTSQSYILLPIEMVWLVLRRRFLEKSLPYTSWYINYPAGTGITYKLNFDRDHSSKLNRLNPTWSKLVTRGQNYNQ